MKKFRISYFSSFFFLLPFALFAQIGGKSTYKFLTLSKDARITALGGSAIAINDNDLGLALANPSLINKNISSSLGLNFIEYFNDINYGFAAYAHNFDKVGTFTGALQYVNYGNFTEADETGQTYGNFKAADYAFNVGWGKTLSPHFLIGSNFKIIYSNYYDLNSFGLAADVAGTYFNEKNQLAISLLAQNIGTQITTYTDGNREPLPFELSLAVSKKLEHAPLRFIFNFEELQHYKLIWEDPNNPPQRIDPLTGDSLPEKKFNKFLDNTARHFIPGVEFTPTKNLAFRVAYNYRRSKEMRVEERISTVGFSFGVGVKIKKIQISYARSLYHFAGSPNHFTITTKLSDFSRKNIE